MTSRVVSSKLCGPNWCLERHLESCVSKGKEADDKENAEGEGAEKQKEDIKPELVMM